MRDEDDKPDNDASDEDATQITNLGAALDDSINPNLGKGFQDVTVYQQGTEAEPEVDEDSTQVTGINPPAEDDTNVNLGQGFKDLTQYEMPEEDEDSTQVTGLGARSDDTNPNLGQGYKDLTQYQDTGSGADEDSTQITNIEGAGDNTNPNIGQGFKDVTYFDGSGQAAAQPEPSIVSQEPPSMLTAFTAGGSGGTKLRPGSIIRGRFKIEKVLGRGGMGSVYRALDLRKQEAQDAHPHIAMKVLNPELANHPKAFIMLQREARKSQELAHPNIVTVFDFDRVDDLIYMTMEELIGKPLTKFIAEHPEGLPKEEMAEVLEGITQGLHYAHVKGIIHNDLKPGNVFMTEAGTLKLLDFGIARAMPDATKAGTDTVFDAKELGGLTPSYASVEMFAGDPPSPGDDVYALGLIAYQLATGKHPFDKKPAPEVLAEGLEPERPRNLSRREWAAVSGAIRFDDKRITDVETFRKLYFGSSKPAIFGGIAASLLVATTAAVMTLTAPPDGPSIPFEELPAETQTQITSYLGQAEEALKFRDINAALLYLENIEELHQGNLAAQDLAENVVSMVTEGVTDWDSMDGRRKLTALLAHEVLERNPTLRDLAKEIDLIIEKDQ